jgi:hypothetical protein
MLSFSMTALLVKVMAEYNRRIHRMYTEDLERHQPQRELPWAALVIQQW